MARWKVELVLCLACFLNVCVYGQVQTQPWHFVAANLPMKLSAHNGKKPMVVAIVDDGVRSTHDSIQPFLWRNPREVPFNGIDDDGNGFLDDMAGWDVSDGDPNPIPPSPRLEEFYHGTHLAGIVTHMARRVLGEQAHKHIKILPVKAISDHAQRTYLKEGFLGIEYAASVGADIILCAWNVGQIKSEEAKILQQAAQNGCFVVAAAGNFPDNKEVFPAAHETVFAVAGLDQHHMKMPDSNYGMFVDLSAPGVDISSAGTISDTDIISKTGTSQAAAMVAATAALRKVLYPDSTRLELEMALKNGSQPLKEGNPLYHAKLGSGRLDVTATLASDVLSPKYSGRSKLHHPKGFLHYTSADDPAPVTWEILYDTPATGAWLSMAYMNVLPGDGQLQIFPTENGVPQADKRQSIRLADMHVPLWIEGASPIVMYYPDEGISSLEWVIGYQIQPVDVTSKYCEGVLHLSQPGLLEDGSGESPYSPLTSCKWHITAPKGKVVRFHFLQFDTEPEHDSLYFFNGRETQENILAHLSGRQIPSSFDSSGSEVLIWFLSDAQNQSAGWKLRYEFVTLP